MCATDYLVRRRFFFLSTAVLTIGIVRSELVALLWGGGFCFLFVFGVIGNLLYSGFILRYLGRTPDSHSFVLPIEGVYPRQEASAIFRIGLPILFVPGFTVSFETQLSWGDERRIRIRIPLGPGANRPTYPFKAPRRGEYAGDGRRIVIEDLLGFTRSYLSLPGRDRLTVLPEPVLPAMKVNRLEAGGERNPRDRRKVRSNELYEVRKYYPGDDSRRLNWKLFAHIGELYLRIGEETPPPESRVVVILDKNPGDLPLPRDMWGGYLDTLVAMCAALCSSLIERGAETWFSAGGGGRCVRVDGGGYKEFLHLLAGIWWDEKKNIPPLPEGKAKALIVTTPSSPTQDTILDRIDERGWPAAVLLKKADETIGRRPGSRLRAWLFVEEGRSVRDFKTGVTAASGAHEFNERLLEKAAHLRTRISEIHVG